jgi:hypothetical protein
MGRLLRGGLYQQTTRLWCTTAFLITETLEEFCPALDPFAVLTVSSLARSLAGRAVPAVCGATVATVPCFQSSVLAFRLRLRVSARVARQVPAVTGHVSCSWGLGAHAVGGAQRVVSGVLRMLGRLLWLGRYSHPRRAIQAADRDNEVARDH